MQKRVTQIVQAYELKTIDYYAEKEFKIIVGCCLKMSAQCAGTARKAMIDDRLHQQRYQSPAKSVNIFLNQTVLHLKHFCIIN